MKPTQPNPRLCAANAQGDEVDTAWDADNQQWWNWYMSLAAPAGPREGVEAPPLPRYDPVSLARVERELAEPYAIDAGARARFSREGFVKLGGVLDPAGLLTLRAECTSLLRAEVEHADRLEFPSLELVWLRSPRFAAYVRSPRLARIAAELLGVPVVRLYHDNLLSKNPGCGRTPWHFDAHHYPLDSSDVVTAWFPLQPTPTAMGSLEFACGMDTAEHVRSIPFDKHTDAYDRRIHAHLRDAGTHLDTTPYALGEVSFHHAMSVHGAGANRTQRPRLAVATTYFADGTRLVAAPTMISGDYAKFMPGVEPGGLIDSPLNPILYPLEHDA